MTRTRGRRIRYGYIFCAVFFVLLFFLFYTIDASAFNVVRYFRVTVKGHFIIQFDTFQTLLKSYRTVYVYYTRYGTLYNFRIHGNGLKNKVCAGRNFNYLFVFYFPRVHGTFYAITRNVRDKNASRRGKRKLCKNMTYRSRKSDIIHIQQFRRHNVVVAYWCRY